MTMKKHKVVVEEKVHKSPSQKESARQKLLIKRFRNREDDKFCESKHDNGFLLQQVSFHGHSIPHVLMKID